MLLGNRLTTASRDLDSRFFTAELFSSHGLYFKSLFVCMSLLACCAAILFLMRSFMVVRQSFESLVYSWQVNRANTRQGK